MFVDKETLWNAFGTFGQIVNFIFSVGIHLNKPDKKTEVSEAQLCTIYFKLASYKRTCTISNVVFYKNSDRNLKRRNPDHFHCNGILDDIFKTTILKFVGPRSE